MDPKNLSGMPVNMPQNQNVPPPNMPYMPLVNTPPVAMPPQKKASRTAETIWGILIGIFQIPILSYFLVLLSGNIIVQMFSSNLVLIPVIYIALIIIEFILLRKKHKNMARGILIGTVLIPVLAYGACLLILSSGVLNGL